LGRFLKRRTLRAVSIPLPTVRVIFTVWIAASFSRPPRAAMCLLAISSSVCAADQAGVSISESSAAVATVEVRIPSSSRATGYYRF
jgi:hypothetical protein